MQLACANTLEVCKLQSLVPSNMSHMDLCGFSLPRASFLKVVWLANRNPTAYKITGFRFLYLLQLMKTISFQPTEIK